MKPPGKGQIYNESGHYPAAQNVEILANTVVTVKIMTPDRTFSPDLKAMVLVTNTRSLQYKRLTFTTTRRLVGVNRNPNKPTRDNCYRLR